MRPLVSFPDVETALVGWLHSVLPAHGLDVPVATRVPNPRPARFVRLARTGGPADSLVVDAAQVTVECWNDNAFEASQDAVTVRAVLNAARNVRAPSGALIYSVNEFSGPAALPDASGQPRYSWTVQVRTRGVQI